MSPPKPFSPIRPTPRPHPSTQPISPTSPLSPSPRPPMSRPVSPRPSFPRAQFPRPTATRPTPLGSRPDFHSGVSSPSRPTAPPSSSAASSSTAARPPPLAFVNLDGTAFVRVPSSPSSSPTFVPRRLGFRRYSTWIPLEYSRIVPTVRNALILPSDMLVPWPILQHSVLSGFLVDALSRLVFQLRLSGFAVAFDDLVVSGIVAAAASVRRYWADVTTVYVVPGPFLYLVADPSRQPSPDLRIVDEISIGFASRPGRLRGIVPVVSLDSAISADPSAVSASSSSSSAGSSNVVASSSSHSASVAVSSSETPPPRSSARSKGKAPVEASVTRPSKRPRPASSSSSSSSGNSFPQVRHSDRFLTAACSDLYDVICSRVVLAERRFLLDSFHSVSLGEVLAEVHLDSAATMFCSYWPSLVREFYANLLLSSLDPASPWFNRVYVRNSVIDFSPDSINHVLRWPFPGFQTPYPDGFTVDFDTVAQTITGRSDELWPDHRQFIPSSVLSVRFFLLYKVLVLNVWQTKQHTQVSRDLAVLLFCVGCFLPVNIGAIISSRITQHATSFAASLSVLHPSLISALISRSRLVVPSDEPSVSCSPISYTAKVCSATRLLDLPVVPAASTRPPSSRPSPTAARPGPSTSRPPPQHPPASVSSRPPSVADLARLQGELDQAMAAFSAARIRVETVLGEFASTLAAFTAAHLPGQAPSAAPTDPSAPAADD